MRSVERASVTEIAAEAFVGFDGASKPTYQSRGTITGRVVRSDRISKRADGSEVRTQYDVWIDADEGYLPIWRDRLAFDTLGETRTAIVEFHHEARTTAGIVDHIELECREA